MLATGRALPFQTTSAISSRLIPYSNASRTCGSRSSVFSGFFGFELKMKLLICVESTLSTTRSPFASSVSTAFGGTSSTKSSSPPWKAVRSASSFSKCW